MELLATNLCKSGSYLVYTHECSVYTYVYVALDGLMVALTIPSYGIP